MKAMSRFVLSVCLMFAATSASTWAQSPRPPGQEPIISEELMARLIKFTMASDKDAWINPRTCATLGICDGTGNMPVKRIVATQPDGQHHFMVPLKVGSKDIIVAFKLTDIVVNWYLTDKSGNLRAAAVLDSTGIRLITNEQAAEKFKAAMQLLAKLAEKVPPTGTAAPGNK
jgi:hypothetical protein